MAQDHLYWKNGINNEFSPTSLTDTADGSGYIATVIISSVTTNSSWHMSQYAAYKDLFERLHQGQINVLPWHTTTEKNALTNVYDGVQVLDITLGRVDVCFGSSFISSAGDGMAQASAFGEMEEVDDAGFTIPAIWINASEDVIDANGNITFVSDDTNGDYLLVGTDGGGTYRIEFLSILISSTGNPVTVQVTQNGTGLSKLKETLNTSTSEYKSFDDWEDMVLVAGDKLRLIHTISSGTMTAVTVKLELERID